VQQQQHPQCIKASKGSYNVKRCGYLGIAFCIGGYLHLSLASCVNPDLHLLQFFDPIHVFFQLVIPTNFLQDNIIFTRILLSLSDLVTCL
jgi:hypothetical protein